MKIKQKPQNETPNTSFAHMHQAACRRCRSCGRDRNNSHHTIPKQTEYV